MILNLSNVSSRDITAMFRFKLDYLKSIALLCFQIFRYFSKNQLKCCCFFLISVSIYISHCKYIVYSFFFFIKIRCLWEKSYKFVWKNLKILKVPKGPFSCIFFFFLIYKKTKLYSFHEDLLKSIFHEKGKYLLKTWKKNKYFNDHIT